MKKSMFVLILFLIMQPCHSQDYMDEILKKSCECVSNILDTAGNQDFNLALGMCIIEASMPYQKQLKKEYDIDLNNISDPEVGEKLGTMIGVKMIAYCPTTFQKLSERSSVAEDQELDDIAVGVITRIENEGFVIFSIKDDLGKVSKFYWLTFIESDVELMGSYASLTGKTISVSYRKEDYFDPRIEQYRQFYIIKKLKVIQ